MNVDHGKVMALLQSDEEETAHKVQNLSIEISKVEINIDTLNKLKEDAIERLEKEKEELREKASKGYQTTRKSADITAEIQHIEIEHKHVMDQITEKYGLAKQQKISINVISDILEELDKEIARIQAEHAEKTIELAQEKEELLRNLSSIEKLGLLINALTYKVCETQEEYAADIEELNKERERILNDTDLTEEERARALEEIHKITSKKTRDHEDMLRNLHEQRSSLNDESIVLTQNINTHLKALKDERQRLVQQLEREKVGASPSKVKEINEKLGRLKKQEEKSGKITTLKDILAELEKSKIGATPSQLQLIEEKIRDFRNELQQLEESQKFNRLMDLLKAGGLQVTPSGHLLTASGRIITMAEARALGYLEGVTSNEMLDLIKHKQMGLHKGEGDSVRSSSSTLSVQSTMGSADVLYLKTVLGKALTLALAEITAKQPQDPIHYLAHWLIKYRFNQEIDMTKKKEVDELTAERARIAKETLNRILEEEARTAVIEMIRRAEDFTLQRRIDEELRRIAGEAGMMEENNEELEDEARDTLGVYGGPPVNANLNKYD